MLHLDDYAKALGLKSYDVALPQPWVNKVVEKFHESPYGCVVWSYDEYDGSRLFGAPVAIFSRGNKFVKDYWNS